MRKFLSILLIASVTGAFAQPKGKEAKMAAQLTSGYYLNMKGDSIKGEIQTNPEDETLFYQGFSFKPKGAGKVAPMSSKKAKGYGFEGRHFILVPYDSEKEVYIELLVNGRLKFFEYKFHDTKDGEPIIASSYYIQDTRAEEKDAELKELKPISTKFYKKDLKPYMKDQPITWTDLDKFTFNKTTVVNALIEFNKYYEQPQ